jgi:hypothetical protein
MAFIAETSTVNGTPCTIAADVNPAKTADGSASEDTTASPAALRSVRICDTVGDDTSVHVQRTDTLPSHFHAVATVAGHDSPEYDRHG